MGTNHLLVSAMARKCGRVIASSESQDRELPESLRPSHLAWMCERIERRAEDWPESRLHRWIGFVQGGMLANRMLDLEEAKALFDAAKNAYAGGEDQDLMDHLDRDNSFRIEIGGEG